MTTDTEMTTMDRYQQAREDFQWRVPARFNIGVDACDRWARGDGRLALIFESTGGGGWGDPRERDPQRVAEDVRNDVISADKAREVYGVALTDDGDVDAAKTAELRSS